MLRCELYNDNFQNFKVYNIPAKAQLVISDIPYNLGKNAYGSNPEWYINGDNKNGESKKAGKSFFNTDFNFNIAEFFHFCSKLLIKEPKERGKAPAMIVFCAWQQIPLVQEYGRKHGFMNSYPLYFIKDFSAQVLKANMRIVGGVETALVLYRDKLPKFNNHGQIILNHMPWPRESKTVPKIHPTQKPIALLKRLIEIFTDAGDVVIDPCAGSGTTLRAAAEMGRTAYGFEVDKKFYKLAQEKMLNTMETPLFAEV
jgi:site-specific DNA-methyltransferase (adenine-specific)